MKLGNWQLDSVSGGTFRLDGGAMFGVVPKPAWNRYQPADAENRILLETNCVLARDDSHTVLIDTGFGDKAADREREQMDLQTGANLVDNLANLGVAVEDIDTVLFSHLHFDHSEGATRFDDTGNLIPTFPKATYVANRQEWEDATGGVPELRGAYPTKHLLALNEHGRLRLVDDREVVVPGIGAHQTGGHTRGHHYLKISSGGQTAVYLGDLCPTQSHMRMLWCMGYDMHPLDTRRQKPQLLGKAADREWIVLWDHDPDMAGARIARDERKEFVVTEEYQKL